MADAVRIELARGLLVAARNAAEPFALSGDVEAVSMAAQLLIDVDAFVAVLLETMEEAAPILAGCEQEQAEAGRLADTLRCRLALMA